MASKLLPLLAMLLVMDFSVGRMTSLKSPPSRKKRSDDSGPLGVVVEQLAQQVLSLTQQLHAANAKITDLQTRAASTEKTVAFYAGNRHDKIPVAPRGAIILDTAFTNVGNGYDTSTGVFTAPVSGLYDLQATFMENDFTVARIDAVIQVDGHEVAGGVVDSSGGSAWDQTSIRAIVHVTSGQKVILKSAVNAVVNFYGLAHTRFSGFLIRAD